MSICNMMKTVNVIKVSFDQDQFITGYLIFDFRPTYVSYLQKISANSHSHNVKKEVEPSGSIPVVKRLKMRYILSVVCFKSPGRS